MIVRSAGLAVNYRLSRFLRIEHAKRPASIILSYRILGRCLSSSFEDYYTYYGNETGKTD